ncbi:diisopropyl-fluorophosphatase [Biomphalaria glabrata]|uniref:SMP-30/Gluconolactonase/LRE-like region domain-containing protein n=1 Tax=Biomphalaria glabrata TaxID=6526 RepID=A0A2C9JWS3_BIOGL
MASFFPLFRKITDNILGAEGPVFDSKGNFYMVAPEVEKEKNPAGQILKVDILSGTTEVLCEPVINGDGGIPAGCQTDKHGNIYVADMRLGILLVQPNGDFEQLSAQDSEGHNMQGCNDCAMDYYGNLWVTAPAGEIAPSPYRRSFEEPFGSIYCLTKDRKVVHLDTGIRFPNGIAVIHDKEDKPVKLIVAETPTRLLWSYDILGPGSVRNKTVWGKLPDCDCESGPDGMDFDETGHLLVAHWGSGYIEVFPPTGGEPVQRIKCPFDKPSNLHFKNNSNEVYVTEHTNHGLWSFEWEHKGMAQYCDKL